MSGGDCGDRSPDVLMAFPRQRKSAMGKGNGDLLLGNEWGKREEREAYAQRPHYHHSHVLDRQAWC